MANNKNIEKENGVRAIFINNLKYYRKESCLTQEKLAEKINKSASYIGEIESRKRFPSPKTIDDIADVFGIDVSFLFSERGSPNNIKNKFFSDYGNTIQKELKEKISDVIDEVCNKL